MSPRIYQEVHWVRYPAIWLAVTYWMIVRAAEVGCGGGFCTLSSQVWTASLYVWGAIDLVRMFKEELAE